MNSKINNGDVFDIGQTINGVHQLVKVVELIGIKLFGIIIMMMTYLFNHD